MKKSKIFFILSVAIVALTGCSINKTGTTTVNPDIGTENMQTESHSESLEEFQTGSESESDTKSETETNITEQTPENDVPQTPEVENREYPLDDNVEDGIVIDLSLANAIRNELGYGSDYTLTYADLEAVTSISAFFEPINSLKGVSQLVNLTNLSISFGNIEDISELGELQNLNTVDISNCYIDRIPDLSGCTNLETIYLPGNIIKDISPLCQIDSLKYVALTDNRINSIEPISEVHNIISLAIDNNCILDYESIAENNNLIMAINEGSQCTYAQCIEVEKKAKAIAATFPKGISELELEKIIYQYVIDNMEFEVMNRPASAFAYHGITDGVGVCGDYAELFCMLAGHSGIEAYTCGSETHAWNVVKIDGKYYHCDTLWDEPEDEWIYFNVSKEYILTIPDHTYDTKKFPEFK